MTSSTSSDRSVSSCSSAEQQLVLLYELADSLTRAQKAILQSDLHGLEEHTLLQSTLCEQLRRLRTSSAPGGITAGADEWDTRWRELAEKLAEAEKQVRHLNAVYRALIQRAQRSLQIMENLFGHALGTYHPLDTQLRAAVSSQVRG